jgi:pimeloyl-ACP methyl ester carboxylesterase
MNAHRTDTLEILAAPAAQPRPGMPPLLFIHGAYTAAWCWAEHFLPYFAQAGFNCQAVNLSGHGASRRRDHLDSYSIDDYIKDIAEVVALLPTPPVLIGHSMGGFVAQKYLEDHQAAAAVLMCSVPPQGLAASAFGMLFSRPNLFVDLNGLMSGGPVALGSLQEALFAQPVSMDDLGRYVRMAQPESHRAIWDMMLLNLPRASHILTHLPRGRDDLRVIGAGQDLIIPASMVEMTARTYGVEATLYAGMGHGLMLERDWQTVAQDLSDWLAARFG